MARRRVPGQNERSGDTYSANYGGGKSKKTNNVAVKKSGSSGRRVAGQSTRTGSEGRSQIQRQNYLQQNRTRTQGGSNANKYGPTTDLKRSEGPQNSRLSRRTPGQSTRTGVEGRSQTQRRDYINRGGRNTAGNKRAGTYNGKMSSDVADFLGGNTKQIVGSFLSSVGTVKKKVDATNLRALMEEDAKGSLDAIRKGSKYYGTPIESAAKKRAKERSQKANQSLVDTADSLLQSGSKDIEKIKEGKNSFEKLMIDTGSAGAQMAADLAIGGGIGKGLKLGAKGLGAATNATMGLRAAGGGMSEARQSGATINEQLAYGILSGGVEVATEKLGNIAKPFKKLYGKGVTDDVVENLAQKAASKFAKSSAGKDIVNNLVRFGFSATEEGAEEMVSEIVSPALKNLTYSKDEKVDWGDVLYSGLVGSALGGILGGGSQVIDYTNKRNAIQEGGLSKPDAVSALISEGLASDETSSANRIAKQLKNIVESGGQVGTMEIAALQRANQEAINAESYAMEQQNQLAQRAADRQGLAPLTMDTDSGMRVVGGATAARLKQNTGNVAQKLMASQTMNEEEAVDTASAIGRIMVGIGDSNDFSVLLPSAENEVARQIYMEETGAVLPNTNEGTRTVLSRANMINNLMMRQEETRYQNQQQEQEITQEARASLGESGMAAFTDMIQQQDSGSYRIAMQEFKKYYDGGTVNFPLDQIYQMSQNDNLPVQVRAAAWMAGYNDSLSRRAAKRQKETKPSKKEKKTAKKKSGTFQSKVSLKVVSKEKQDGLKRIAESLNVDIVLDPKLEHDANGTYLDGTIHISANSDNPIMTVLKHELTHHIQRTAPKEYQKLKDFVMQEFYKGDAKAFQAAIDQKVNAYARQGEKLSRDEAIDEIIANSTEKFLTDEKTIEKIVAKDRSLGQAILDAIKKMIQSIKSLLVEASGVDRGYSKFLEDLNILNKAERMWVDALKVSVENGNTEGSNYAKFELKDIDMSEKDIEQNRRIVGRMDYVADLTGEEFAKGEKGLTQQVSEFFVEQGNSVRNKELGDIGLNERGVKDSIAHGIGRKKAIAFKAVPDVLKKGKIIDYQKNWKNRDYDTVIVAAPITIAQEPYYMGAIVIRQEAKGDQRYYLHEVLIEKRTDSPFKTGDLSLPGGESYPSLISLLQKVKEIKNDVKQGQKSGKSFSLKDTEGRKLTERQAKFFSDVSPYLKDSNGNLKVYYHGTGRADRVGTIFRPERATSGPMAYFTDNNTIAERYSKDKSDTSLAYDEEYDSYETQFRVERNGENLSVIDLWNRLSPKEKISIKKKAPHIVLDDDYENVIYDEEAESGLGNFDSYLMREHRGNALSALVDSWLNGGNIFGEERMFLDVLRLVGIEDAKYMDPEYREEKVYETYLNVTNPLVTSELDEAFVEDVYDFVNVTDLSVYEKENAAADMWDKNNRDVYEWIEHLEEDIEKGTSYTWTSVPDVITDFLKSQGYDGIVDTGGKNGGAQHQVVIPFYSEQVKSVENKNPSEDPDIRYSLKEDTDITYDRLVGKPDMSVVPLKKINVKKLSRKDIVNAGRKSAKQFGATDEYNRIFIKNDDVGSNIVIGAPAIRHGLQRDYETNALISMNLGGYLKNAIKINEIEPRGAEMISGYVLLGYGRNEIGEDYPAYFVVRTLVTGKDELVDFDSLYSFNGKKIVEAVGSANQGIHSLTSTTISISDLLDVVNERYSDILPKSVAEHYRNKRKQSKLGQSVKFSLKEEDRLYEYLNTSEVTQFHDMPPVRDYDKTAKSVRMKSIEELTRQVEALKQETKLTHGKLPDQRDLLNQSTNLVRILLNGKVKKNLVDMAANNAGQMFTLIKRGYEEDAIIQAYNTARELVENMDLVDDTLYVEYKSLRDYLRKTPIRVTETDRPTDYNDFRRSQMGRLKLVNKNGLPIDTVYEELKELYPGLFSEDIVTPADQLQEIADVRSSLEPYDIMLSSEETEQLIKETASDLLEIAYNGKPRRTFADKKKEYYDTKIKRLKEQQKEAKDNLRKQYQGIVKRHDEKARQKRMEDKRKTRGKAEKKQYVGSITKNVDWLSERLVKPTDNKHLPDGFETAVAELLQCFDLQTDRSKALEKKTGKKGQKTLNFENLMRQYQKIAAEDGSGEIEYDGYVYNLMDALAEKLQGKTIDQASNADLHEIDILLKAIVGNFRNINKAFTEGVKETISQMGDDAIADFRWKRSQRKQAGKNENLVDRLLNESMVTPRDFFELMGGSFDTLYGNIRKGFDKHIKNIDQTRGFFEDLFKQYYNKKKPGSELQAWSAAKAQVEFKLEQGGTVKLNPAQIMTLYCLNKREQAQGHIYASGIVASEVSEGKKLKQKLIGERSNTSKTSFVTINDVEKMIGTLTPDQIKIADKLQQYINTTCTKWGNETSLRLNNYKKFGEKNYFPITSAKEYLDADFSKRTNNLVETIKNASFTKNTVINANNPIMIADIFEVVTDHINKMSMYNAFAAPIADFQKVYNYKQRDKNGLQTTSVQVEMRETHGKKALSYINNLMADLNNFSGRNKDPFESLMNKGLAAYKKAAIGFNFRVAIQQPTAIARAFVHINPVYFVNGKINMKKNLREMKEHCPIALWKSWGFSQTDVARDMKDIIMNDNWSKLDLVTMAPYGALDNATWSVIWAAVKRETEVKHKDVEIGSDEYWQICADRASYIYDKTQVVDSPLHRSQVMRNQSVGLKMVTSFMAEPTRTFNMCRTECLKGIQEIKNGNKAAGISKINKVAVVFAVNAALVSAAAAIADAMRGKNPDDDDDDEDKTFAEYWLENFWANLGDNGPLSMIPLVKDVKSISEGWGTSNMAMEGAEAIITAATNWRKYIDGESNKTPAELMRKSAEALGMVTGLPIKNAIREFESWTKLFGIEVHAATTINEEKPEAEKNLIDKFREWLGRKNEKSDKKAKSSSGSAATDDWTYEDRLNEINDAIAGLSGTERQEAIWKKATYGYTTCIENGEYDKIATMERLLQETGGDVEKFKESVQSETKSAFKKCIGVSEDAKKMELYRNQLYEYGYTDAKISQELIAKSNTAKDFKKACAIWDEDAAVETLQSLRDAGITYEDAYALYINRSSGIKASDYSSGELSWPVDGDSRISSYYGHRNSPGGIGSTNHVGIDIAAAAGSNVLAADGGKVTYAGYNSARGYYIDIDHGNGRKTRYQHLQGYTVQKGDVVKKGQHVAYVGSTGNSTGPHLHIEVLENGNTVDPMLYFK